jgi:UDP-N-acetylglucosamine--N-acetylmuramyl-(pentapeptide) pyrophosphoryl-undecaprenol N-acetylglucosamine transferase
MVLVTTGTNESSFDRLVEAAGELTGELLVQYGSSAISCGPHGQWIDFMPFDELRAAMLEADVVVCHAGVGSVMLAQRCGKRPVVMPRRVALGEAVDDHQVAFAQRLARLGAVTLAESGPELALAVAAELDHPTAHPGAHGQTAISGGLAGELRAFLAERTA